jgi:carbonyl reductase 1
MSTSTIAKVFVVTGANKGIGYGIVRGIAEQIQSSLIYLTARNPSLGEEALKKVIDELGDRRLGDIRFHQLDITNEDSCRAFANFLNQEHSDGIDVLINNAGIAFRKNATEPAGIQAEVTITTNYYGTKLVTKYLEPLIKEGGRIVNVCSQAGIMSGSGYSDTIIAIFRRPDYTEADIDRFVENYKRFAHEETRREHGYPESAYRVSKAAEIAYSQLLARQLNSRNIIVNACCPGYVDTDMTGTHKGHLTIAEGSDTPIYLAVDPDVPSGEFVYKRKAKQWL